MGKFYTQTEKLKEFKEKLTSEEWERHQSDIAIFTSYSNLGLCRDQEFVHVAAVSLSKRGDKFLIRQQYELMTSDNGLVLSIMKGGWYCIFGEETRVAL